MARETKKENPLMSKNIPRPPATPERIEELDNDTMVERDNGKTASPQSTITGEPQDTITAKPLQPEQDEEKATEKLTLYLHPSQRDKLDALILEYRRETGKRITHNRLMRMMIEKVQVRDLL
jgi:hypothetical protein